MIHGLRRMRPDKGDSSRQRFLGTYPRRRKRGRQGGELRAVQLECTLARPPWVAAACFSLHGSGKLSVVAFILESQIDLWTTGIPYHCRCMIAGRLLAGYKTLKNDLHTLQFV